MPIVEVTLPDELLSEFEQLVSEEFVSEEQAVEDLLTMGIDAYNVDVMDDSDPGDDIIQGAENNLFDTASDPGGIDDDRL
jgi:L-lysine 2,3-aminomutase